VRVWGAAHLAPAGTSGFLDGFSVEGDAVHVGLFHGSELGGWARETDVDKVQHAPFRAAQVPASGLHHAVVGHHHRRVAGDHHTYPGCPVPLSFGGDGDGGAVLIELGPEGTVVDRHWHRVSSLEVHELVVQLDGCEDSGDLERRVDEAVAGCEGVARLTLQGEVAPTLSLNVATLAGRRGALVELVVRTGRLRTGHDIDAVSDEPTVRGQFVRDVLASDLEPDEQQRVIITGLRALEGRDDLEVA
jgi:exonuclease SbcD